MSHTGRTADGDAGSASDVAAALAGAPFVHVVARADGDSLAAAGLVARALADDGTPFQVSVGRTVAERTERAGTGDDRDGRTLVVGESDADAVHLDPADEPASVAAWRLANDLGGAPDAVLALAGAVAAGATPGAGATERLVDAAETTGRVVRRPGVALPTDDPADVAHSTWLHGPFSAGVDAASALTGAADDLVDADESAHRRFASLAAVETVTDDDATDRAGTAVERGLRPYATPDSATASVAGLADLLSCTAVTAPGTGVALALGHDVADAAVEAWRETAAHAHQALATATTGRYDGLFVARVDDDAPAPVVARLLRDFRSPEPVALALADDAAAAAAVENRDIAGAMGRTVTRTGGSYDGTATTGYATYECETKEFIHAFREVL